MAHPTRPTRGTLVRNLTISQRLLTLLLVGSAFVLLLLAGFGFTSRQAEIAAGDLGAEILDKEVRAKLETATHAMAHTLAQIRAESADEATFVRRATSLLQDLRYEEDNSGYFYVYRGTVPVVHPIKPKNVGKDLAGKTDARGNPFVRKRAEMIAKDGRATLEYFFTKPGGGEAMKLAYAERIPGTDFLVGTGAYLDNVEASRAQIRSAISEASTEGLLWVLLPLLLIGAAAVLPLSVSLSRSITRPLQDTVDAMEGIATGDADLTLRLAEDGADEIAQLGSAFNRFANNLSAMIRKVADSSTLLSESASTLATSSGRISDVARGMRTRTESTARAMQDVNERVQAIASTTEVSSSELSSVASTTEQLSGHAIQVASGSQRASDEISTVAAAIEQLGASFDEVAASCQTSASVGEQSATQVGLAVEQLRELQEAASSIGGMVDLINDVADQTSLLALNATIEAASAGEAGRGFAVVAGEVKILAQETAKATKDITAYVERMQAATGRSSKMMTEVATHTDELRRLTNTIAAAAEEQTMAIREVSQSVSLGASAVENVKQGISDISGGVDGLADNNNKLAAGTSDMATAARSMAARATEVANDVDVIMGESDTTAQEIEGVDRIAQDLKTQASGLQRIVAGFKA